MASTLRPRTERPGSPGLALRRVLPAWGFSLALVACGGSERGCSVASGYGHDGELGQGHFTYACGAEDQACAVVGRRSARSGENPESRASSLEVPYAVAEGARFRLGYAPSSEANDLAREHAAALTLEAASPAILRADERPGDGAWFVGQATGAAAIFVRAATENSARGAVGAGESERSGERDGAVLDLVHVRVESPTRVRFLVRDEVLPLWTGESERIRAVVEGDPLPASTSPNEPPQGRPAFDRRALLAGIAAHTTSANPAVARVARDEDGVATVVGGAPGETLLTASYGGLLTSLRVRVVARANAIANVHVDDKPQLEVSAR